MIDNADLHTATFARLLDLVNPPPNEADCGDIPTKRRTPLGEPVNRSAIVSDDSTVPLAGRVIGHYSVTRYVDTRNLDEVPSFLVTCVQRTLLYNGFAPFCFEQTPGSYGPYPALLESVLTPEVEDNTEVRLIDYWPRTLNSAVQTDVSESRTTDSNVLRQHTSGSSTSTTNSYGVNGSITGGGGPEGPSGSASIGGNYEHSTTLGTNSENTVGSSLTRGLQFSGAASMTIKDWGSYAELIQAKDSLIPTIRWVWGQEYPWDLFLYRATGSEVVPLPQFLQDRLGDVLSGWTAPPSELSMFGLDLVAHATWQIIPPRGAIDPPTIGFHLRGKIGQGSHSTSVIPTDAAGDAKTSKAIVADDPPAPRFKVKASLSTTYYEVAPIDKPLDLELLALDPITAPGGANGAALGFSPETAPNPVVPLGKFRQTSAANTLALRGTGFLTKSKNSYLKADLSNGGTATVEIYFKIVDTDEEYSLILKHWKTDVLGCVLTFDINGAIEVIRHVDDLEAEGGANNVTSIALRALDFTAEDYHDYLRLGMNRITITIAAEPSPQPDDDLPCGYVLRALAVG